MYTKLHIIWTVSDMLKCWDISDYNIHYRVHQQLVLHIFKQKVYTTCTGVVLQTHCVSTVS